MIDRQSMNTPQKKAPQKTRESQPCYHAQLYVTFSFSSNSHSMQDQSFELCLRCAEENRGRWGRLIWVGGRLIARFPRVIEKAFYYNLVENLMPKMFP